MKKALGGFTTAAILIFAIIVFLFCTVRIPAGYVGVVYNMNGGISDKNPLARFSYCRTYTERDYVFHRH